MSITNHPFRLALLTAASAAVMLSLHAVTQGAMVSNDNIVNPSFENGSTGWSVTTGGATLSDGASFDGDVTSGADGSKFVSMFGNGGTTVEQTGVTIEPDGLGQLHTLSFFGNWDSGQPVSITGRVLDGTTQNLLGDAQLTLNSPTNSNSTWVEQTFTFTPTSNTIDLEFEDTSSNSGGRDPLLDHITLTYVPIPEPAAVGLIGLGSIVLLSRRRMR